MCFYVVRILSQILKNFAEMRFWGSTLRLFQYYIGVIFQINDTITWGGGPSQFITILQ